MSLIFPDPAAVQVPPPAPTHVHVAVRAAGNVSATVAPGAFDRARRLIAVIVYVTLPPGVADVTPSVFVIARSAERGQRVGVRRRVVARVRVADPGRRGHGRGVARLPVAAAAIAALAV